MNKLFKQRFGDLERQANEIEASKEIRSNEHFGEQEYIDTNILLNWRVKVKSLLSRACGEESQHFCHFERAEKSSTARTTYAIFKKLNAVFLAAKEDFEGGYLSSARTLVQAEVFESELEQAQELLSKKYYIAAAVIAGTVLETALRELCDKESLPHEGLDRMNTNLAKAGAYNKLMQKRITALANIRNSAAHGKGDEFTEQDVQDMIKCIGNFLANQLV